jgi:hypothetical protein
VTPGDGILRSTTGERYREGLAFPPQVDTLRGEISAGWGWQTPRYARLKELEGLLVDANLAWACLAAHDRSPHRALGLPRHRHDRLLLGALSRQVGLEARRSLRRYLVGSPGSITPITPYASVPIEERNCAAKLGFAYYLNQNAIVLARYQHIDFISTPAGSSFTDDIVHVGIPLRRRHPARAHPA